MDLIVLGSSAAIPVKKRNLSSTALKYKNHIVLLDCGEDVQRSYNDAGLKFNKPMIILISHFHGDHIIGLPGLLFRFGLIDRTAPLSIIGPRNLFIYLSLHRRILGLKANYPIKILEIDHEENKLIEYDGLDSENPTNTKPISEDIIFETKRFYLKYALVNHSVITFAYSFNEKPRYGKFNPERARELGIPESRLWKQLQKGESLNFKDKIIDPIKEGIVGPQRPGRKITYSADTCPCQSLIDLGKGSDIVIHESTFSSNLQHIAEERKHSSSIDAANDAKKMGAKQLILTHISSRYQEDALKLLEEAKEVFTNTILAEDGLKITLK